MPPPWVTHMIIFGSALHPWHYFASDLDICIVGKNPGAAQDDFAYRKKLKISDCAYDFVEFEDMDTLNADLADINSIGYSILTEGMAVYEKS